MNLSDRKDLNGRVDDIQRPEGDMRRPAGDIQRPADDIRRPAGDLTAYELDSAELTRILMIFYMTYGLEDNVRARAGFDGPGSGL